MVAWGRIGEGIVKEFGINKYTLLYLKQWTNKDLLDSTSNSAQCCVAGWMGRELEENGCMYVYGWIPWTVIGRTDAEAETPIFWSPDVKSQPIRKDPDAGKDRRQEENGGNRGSDGRMASPSKDRSLSKLREIVKDREGWRAAVHGVAENRTRLSDWTTTNWEKEMQLPLFTLGRLRLEQIWGRGGSPVSLGHI